MRTPTAMQLEGRDAAERRRARRSKRAAGLTTPAPSPKLGPGCWAAEDAAAGGLFLQARVERGGQAGRFDDLAGGGFALVSAYGDPAAALTPEQRAWFTRIGGVCAQIAPGSALHDVDGAYARWFEEHGCAVALQRPDFTVFAAAKKLAGASALVEALRARLRPEE